ncbi:hypothetical protein GCM10028799_10640 [Kribbella italica]
MLVLPAVVGVGAYAAGEVGGAEVAAAGGKEGECRWRPGTIRFLLCTTARAEGVATGRIRLLTIAKGRRLGASRRRTGWLAGAGRGGRVGADAAGEVGGG